MQNIACALAIQMHNKIGFPNMPKDKENGLFVTRHFDVFCNLIPPNNYILSENVPCLEGPVQTYLSCIPNTNQHPQHYSLWWSIGQALKNMLDSHLALWIKWSNQANTIYTNEESECKYAWKFMVVRKDGQKKYGHNFLQNIASFYYPNIDFSSFKRYSMLDDMINIEKFFPHFNQINKYNTDPNNLDTPNGYCKPLDFTDNDSVIIIAAMGLGKTYIVNESIKANHYERILLISPRQTFCQEKVTDLKKICPDFMSYLDEEVRKMYDWSMIDKLAIQV